MRINVYSQELTKEVTAVRKTADLAAVFDRMAALARELPDPC
jgi:hypothetical protein